MGGNETRLQVDEEALRGSILKAYLADSPPSDKEAKLIAALRQLLSGPPGGPSAQDYYFEADPAAAIGRFARTIDRATDGRARAVVDPLLASLAERQREQRAELAPNISVYLASLSGPIALKVGIAETVVSAVLAALLIMALRLGAREAAQLVEAAIR